MYVCMYGRVNTQNEMEMNKRIYECTSEYLSRFSRCRMACAQCSHNAVPRVHTSARAHLAE